MIEIPNEALAIICLIFVLIFFFNCICIFREWCSRQRKQGRFGGGKKKAIVNKSGRKKDRKRESLLGDKQNAPGV